MSPKSLELRVGAFVLLGVLALVVLVLLLGDVSFSPRFPLFADFSYAGGLQEGAPIKVSGVRVGRVGQIELLTPEATPQPASSGPRPVVRASINLDEVARPLLTQGAQVMVGTQGVIGEAYLELTPGPPGAQAIAEGSVLRGIDAAPLHVMARQVAVLLDALSGILEGPHDATTGPVGALFSTANELLREHRGEVSQAIADSAASAAELRAILVEVRQALQGGHLEGLLGDAGQTAATLRDELPALLTSAQRAMGRLDDLSKKADTALDAEAVSGIIRDAKDAAQNFDRLSADARKIVTRIERGEGTVGGLVNDPQIYDDLKEVLRDLKRNPWKMFWRD